MSTYCCEDTYPMTLDLRLKAHQQFATHYRVFLNDKRISGVFYASEEEGKVHRYATGKCIAARCPSPVRGAWVEHNCWAETMLGDVRLEKIEPIVKA